MVERPGARGRVIFLAHVRFEKHQGLDNYQATRLNAGAAYDADAMLAWLINDNIDMISC